MIRLDELNRLVRLHRRTNRFSSTGRITRLSSVFIQHELNDRKTHYTSVV